MHVFGSCHDIAVWQVGRQLYTVTGQQYSEEELQEVVDSGGQDLIYQQALMAPGSQRDVSTSLLLTWRDEK